MNEVRRPWSSPALLPPVTLFGEKKQTMRLCCRLLLLLPLLQFSRPFFSPTVSATPPPTTYFLSHFPTLFIWAHLALCEAASDGNAPLGGCGGGLRVCDPHQATLTQWALCACTQFLTPPLVSSPLCLYIIALLCSWCQSCPRCHANTHNHVGIFGRKRCVCWHLPRWLNV